jgi:O-methyltransferase involved in polyketide biosynthesis
MITRMSNAASEKVSPTAHYTGYVWARNGMSHPAFVTNEGRLLYSAVAPWSTLSRLGRGPTPEGFLLARHRLIDHLLAAAIDAGRVTQVIEIASGLSPRGWTFAERYGDRIDYIETDLTGMVRRKRSILTEIGSLNDRHRVVELNALADTGPQSLAALAATLDPRQGTAIITEGLVNYFGREAVLGMWTRFARELSGFSHGLYLSDLHVQGDSNPALTWAAMLGVSAFVRGRVHLHFDGAKAATEALHATGFGDVVLHLPTDFPEVVGERANPAARMVRVIEAVAIRNISAPCQRS